MTDARASLVRGLAAIGTEVNPSIALATRDLFAPLALPQGDVDVSRDVAYGDDARHRLDVYRPRSGAKGLPVVVHVPGGGFVAGDKRVDDIFLANIGAFFARNEAIGVVFNYRVAPAHPWPGGAEDVGRVLLWLRENVERFGGDPARIILWGISAGATHIASYLFDPSLRREPDGVAGAILSSGLYRITKDHVAAPNMKAYFGDDEGALAARSPLTHAHNNNVPLLLTVSELDPAWFATQTLELATKLTERAGRCPPLAWLKGQNHFSAAFSVGTVDDDVGPRLLDFVATCSRGP